MDSASGTDGEQVLRDFGEQKGTFYLVKDGARAATLTWTRAGALVILDHTEVGEALRGTGAGRKLVAAAVDWARAEAIKLLPLCPFAKSVFDKDPSIRDVLPG
jgi:uncharacterized protein